MWTPNAAPNHSKFPGPFTPLLVAQYACGDMIGNSHVAIIKYTRRRHRHHRRRMGYMNGQHHTGTHWKCASMKTNGGYISNESVSIVFWRHFHYFEVFEILWKIPPFYWNINVHKTLRWEILYSNRFGILSTSIRIIITIHCKCTHEKHNFIIHVELCLSVRVLDKILQSFGIYYTIGINCGRVKIYR